MNFNLQNILRRTNRKLWIYLICVLLPLALLPLAFSPSKESKCAYVLSLVSCYWLLEPVHMAVTAFLPIILFPVLGVISSREVCNNYMSETIIMFIGGLIVAVAVEDSKLHERIALKVLLLIGTELKWLMMGFMLSTMFLSMWINNMATTAMMVPIAEAIIEEIGKTDKDIEMKNADDCYSISEEKTKDKVENGSITKENV